MMTAPHHTALLAVMAVSSTLMLAAPAFGQAVSEAVCGNPFQNHFGPFDYRSARAEDKDIVEKVHFTSGIASLTRTGTSSFAGDIAYTLHVFPNHHRALMTLSRLADRHNDAPQGLNRPLECYFDRAVRFRPDDTVVRGIYAQFLTKRNRKPEAMRHLEIAAKHAEDNPVSQYTIGALYFDLGEFDLALAQAQKAKAGGMERRGLEDALRRTGHWRDAAN